MGVVRQIRKHGLQGVLLIATACMAGALYLQHVLDWQPCPLCVLQRLAFIAAALFAAIGLFAGTRDRSVRVWQGASALASVAGVALAGRHLWVKAHPAVSCGIDPLETVINAQWWAQQVPWLLKADGLCFMPLPPLLGLQLPVWSLLALLLMSVLAVLHQPAHAVVN